MKKRGLVLACLLSVAYAAPSVLAQEDPQFSMDYWGFVSFQPGDMMGGLGFVPLIEPPLDVDLENYQYTWQMQQLVLEEYYTDGEVEYSRYAGGIFEVFEDPDRNAAYDDTECPGSIYISDPNTFTDGILFLLGEVDTIAVTYFPQLHFGYYVGTMDLVGGEHLGDIPEDYRNGWTFGGATDQPWACIPDGYDHRWDGQLFLMQEPTLTEAMSWSRIKAVFK